MSSLAGNKADGQVQAFPLPADAQTTAVTAATSAALTGGMYRVVSTAAATIALGATCVNGLPLAANQPEYFEISDGSTVTVAGAGTVSLTLV